MVHRECNMYVFYTIYDERFGRNNEIQVVHRTYAHSSQHTYTNVAHTLCGSQQSSHCAKVKLQTAAAAAAWDYTLREGVDISYFSCKMCFFRLSSHFLFIRSFFTFLFHSRKMRALCVLAASVYLIFFFSCLCHHNLILKDG